MHNDNNNDNNNENDNYDLEDEWEREPTFAKEYIPEREPEPKPTYVKELSPTSKNNVTKLALKKAIDFANQQTVNDLFRVNNGLSNDNATDYANDITCLLYTSPSPRD